MSCLHQNEEPVSDTDESLIHWCVDCGAISIIDAGIYHQRRWRLSSLLIHQKDMTISRYWGIFNPDSNSWLQHGDGQVFYYPSPAIAQAQCDTYQKDYAAVIDGRGRTVAQPLRLVVKEMIYGPNKT